MIAQIGSEPSQSIPIAWTKNLILASLIYVGGIPPGSEADQFIRQYNLQDTIVQNSKFKLSFECFLFLFLLMDVPALDKLTIIIIYFEKVPFSTLS